MIKSQITNNNQCTITETIGNQAVYLQFGVWVIGILILDIVCDLMLVI